MHRITVYNIYIKLIGEKMVARRGGGHGGHNLKYLTLFT